MLQPIIGFVFIAVLTVLLTGWFRNLSIENHWLDKPTHRGSHHQAVPHIGGVAMMVTLCLTIIVLTISGNMSGVDSIVWLAIVLMLGIVGFIDDIRNLSKRLRLVAQIIVAVIAIWYFGGINTLNIGPINLEFSGFSYVLGFIWVVGFINMYNFMDGINGIAGCQALIAGLILAVWLYHLQQQGESLLFLAVAATACGFLYWNFSPAKVFMGDSGSTMLGGMFAVISLQLHNESNLSIIFPVLLFAWFLADTSITFLKRMLRGEKVWEAHRQHFYQLLAPNPEDHTKVTGIISLISLIIALIITVVVLK